ncbi:MAG: hypothetical protein ACE367_18205 [Acidimicrobiales bacterium]
MAHVVAIGDASPTDVQFACIEARRDLWIRIESVVVDSERWNAHEPDADVAEIRADRLVPIALHRRPVEEDSMPGTVALTIHLDLAQARSLEEVARVDMVSLSEATRNAVSHYVATRRQEPGYAARLHQMDAGVGHDRFGR